MAGPPKPKFKIEEIGGLPFPGGLKAIGFVRCIDCEEKFINAKEEFEKAKSSVQNAIRQGVQYWFQGVPSPGKHHGWTASQFRGAYTECYVFKHIGAKVRYYGFLVHPISAPRAIICCVMHTELKTEDEVNLAILDNVNRFGAELLNAAEEFWKELQSKKEV